LAVLSLQWAIFILQTARYKLPTESRLVQPGSAGAFLIYIKSGLAFLHCSYYL